MEGGPEISSDEWDQDRAVNVWVSLRRRGAKENEGDEGVAFHTQVIIVETPAGAGRLSRAVQLLIAASAFDLLPDVVVEDYEVDDAANAVRYRSKADFLSHASRCFIGWYGRTCPRAEGIIDAGDNVLA